MRPSGNPEWLLALSAVPFIALVACSTGTTGRPVAAVTSSRVLAHDCPTLVGRPLPRDVISDGCGETRADGRYQRAVLTYACTTGGQLLVLAAEDTRPQYWQAPGGVVRVGTYVQLQAAVDICG